MPESSAIREDIIKFEYERLMDSYHHYFVLVAKGVSIYLLIIGACLSLPYTLKFGKPDDLLLFKEMCRMFAFIVSIGAISGFLVPSFVFLKMHMRLSDLSRELNINTPNTWVMPFIMWLACFVAAILVAMIMKYA